MEKDLLISLFDLYQRLGKHSNSTSVTGGMLERYHWFINNSEFKEDCAYAHKSKDLFLRYDYEEIKKLFLDTLEQFRIIEGEKFGR